MSSQKLYRNPAWSGLEPPESGPALEPASSKLSSDICKAIGIKASVWKLNIGLDDAKFLKIIYEDGRSNFIKIVSLARCESMVRAEKIARWLKSRNLTVVAALDETPFKFSMSEYIFRYKYIYGSRIEANIEHVKILGRELAAIHKALAEHPDIDRWTVHTNMRISVLEEVRSNIISSMLTYGPEPDFLIEVAKNTDLSFIRGIGGPRIPLHGDLNPYNVMMSNNNTKPVFLDFEDTFHSVLPVEYELSLVCQRLILIRIDDDREANVLVNAFLGSYRKAGGKIPLQILDNIPIILKSLALRSLCVLVDCERKGIDIAKEEWDKFILLYKQAEIRTNVFKST